MKSRKISILIKLAILILVVYGTVTLVTMRGQINQKKEEANALSATIAQKETENAQIQERIQASTTPEGAAQIAREELGFVAPGEIIIRPVGN